MSNEIEMSKDFQTKMFERIRSQMGDLLSEEELKQLTTKAVEKAFFEERIVTEGSGYNVREVKAAPYFVELIRSELNKEVKNTLDEYMKNNPEVIAEAIQHAIGKGFTQLIFNHIDNKIQSDLYSFTQNLQNTLTR